MHRSDEVLLIKDDVDFTSDELLLTEKHMVKPLNRIKVVLAEQCKTNKWLAQQLHKGPSTVSKWCTNDAHPPLTTLRQIADILDVDIRTLLHPSKPQ